MAAIEVRKDIAFAGCGGQPFKGVLYRPAGVGPHPVLVAVHGGGWKRGSPDSYAVLGPWLAERGYALFATTYRFAAPGKPSWPHAFHDVRAAVQNLRGRPDPVCTGNGVLHQTHFATVATGRSVRVLPSSPGLPPAGTCDLVMTKR